MQMQTEFSLNESLLTEQAGADFMGDLESETGFDPLGAIVGGVSQVFDVLSGADKRRVREARAEQAAAEAQLEIARLQAAQAAVPAAASAGPSWFMAASIIPGVPNVATLGVAALLAFMALRK